MKIVLFNWIASSIDVIPLSDEEERLILENGEDAAFDILKDKDYDTDEPGINWMIVDPDLPVYNYGETIPFIAL